MNRPGIGVLDGAGATLLEARGELAGRLAAQESLLRELAAEIREVRSRL